MRGSVARKIRRIAFKMTQPGEHRLMAKQYKIAAKFLLGKYGEPLALPDKDGVLKQIVTSPAQIHLTAFWGQGSFRAGYRRLKNVYKRGEPRGRKAMLDFYDKVVQCDVNPVT